MNSTNGLRFHGFGHGIVFPLAFVAFALGQPTKDTPTKDARVETVAPGKTSPAEQAGEHEWQSLFNGQDLSGWKVTNFGGEGEVTARNGVLVLAAGSPLTGVTFTGRKPKNGKKMPRIELPTCNYELRLWARRVEGTDFFCGLTFPYKSSHASLILGGWGGSLLGISSIDLYDASENETTRYRKFERNRWYQIRLRVTDDLLEAWIDEDRIVDCDIKGRELTVRPEVELSRPLGIASFDTQAEIRNLELRRLPAPGGKTTPEKRTLNPTDSTTKEP